MKLTQFVGKRDWALALVAVAGIVVQVYLDLKVPDYMQQITQIIVSPNAQLGDVLHEGMLMLACALGSMVATILVAFCVAMDGSTLARHMRAALFEKIMSFSMTEFNKFTAPSLITRTTNDIQQIQMFVVIGLQALVRSPIMAVWAISKIAGQNGTWTAATAVAVVALLILLGIIMGLAMPRMMRMQRITDDLNRVTREHLGGLRVIRAYRAQRYHTNRFEDTNDELTSTNMYIMKAMALLMPSLNVLMSGLSLAIYALGASMIEAASMPEQRVLLMSQMIVFSAYAMQVVGAFMTLTFVFIFFPRARVSYRRLREVMETEPLIHDGPVEAPAEGVSPGTITFENVTFRFPDADDDALHDISFTASPGQTVALIGSTGSGKSSIINLIPRYFDVREGRVLVDGVDVREWTQSALRDRIGYVPQTATLFTGTIASNIDFGESAHDVTPGDIVAAAKTSYSDEFIVQKDDGYASKVVRGGANFSGGQKQRLSIARAVARDPEILIFDDSFSALDYKTDRGVRDNLNEFAADATKLIVAQRIGTVRGADQILVVDRGRIVGQGTHEELMATNAVYQEIAYSQLSEEELA
ncbi:MAG: ABC transporter ATP-binding protein [Ancrocorticia sp.]|uniref:ABC transporter ATP-binding protein n=1 Tax=Ancrocorticia sp. TaxID=2593684 RepID=UPI003F91AC6B